MGIVHEIISTKEIDLAPQKGGLEEIKRLTFEMPASNIGFDKVTINIEIKLHFAD